MNIRQLETFFWVAKLGTFTAAADRLKATQSTVSLRIQELERNLGIALFDRSQRTARLTAKGRSLVPYAEQMLRLSGEIRDRVASAGSIEGTLRVGVAEVVSITWLPRLVKEIHARFPRITLELDEALTQDLVDRLQAGSLDLILAPGRVPGYGRSPVSLGWVDFAWMASPALGLPAERMGPRDLQSWPVIALARESYHHTSIEEWFRSADASCRRIDTCKSLGVAASLAAAGLGLTLLPTQCYQREVAAGRLCIVETAPPLMPVEFTATTTVDGIQPLARRIAAIAAEVSDFGRAPPVAAATRRRAR
jgi:DNA-binding transcriptional LysR family regulator